MDFNEYVSVTIRNRTGTYEKVIQKFDDMTWSQFYDALFKTIDSERWRWHTFEPSPSPDITPMIDRELYVIGLHYPKEAEEIHLKLQSDHGQKMWACQRINELREMLGMTQIQWPVEAVTTTDAEEEMFVTIDQGPCVLIIEPDRYEMLSGQPCYAYFDQMHIKEKIDGDKALKFLGGKYRWEFEIKEDGSQHLRVAMARMEQHPVVFTRPLTSSEGIR